MSLKRFGKFFFVLLVSLLLLEATARIFTPVLESRIPAFYYGKYFAGLITLDEVFVWAGRPGVQAEIANPLGEKIAYRINKAGWRGREFTPLSQPGNALILGDSFAFGMGVREEARLGERLEARLRGLNAWSFALPGFAPDQHALLGLRWLTTFPWAFLVLQLSNNDLQDVSSHQWGYVGGSGLPSTISPPASYYFFSDWSRAWNLMLTFAVGGRLPEPALRTGLERLLHSLEKNLALARELRIPVFIVQASDWGAPAYGEKMAGEYEALVKNLAAKHGAGLLEANKDFQATLLPAPDSHWDAATHDRVAEALFLKIKELPSFQPQKAGKDAGRKTKTSRR